MSEPLTREPHLDQAADAPIDVAVAVPTPPASRVRSLLANNLLRTFVVLAVVWAVGSGLGTYQQYVISLITVYAIVGIGVVLLIGVAGQLSLGHAAFFAIGGYTAANIADRWTVGLPAELAIAILLAALVGAIVGLPSLRLSGLLLAAGTLALGFAGQQVLYTWTPVTGGNQGKSVGNLVSFGTPVTLLHASLIVLALSMLVAYNIMRGRSGRAFHALRTADIAARSVGIDVERRRIIAFALSGAFTAAGGVLYGHAVTFVSPDTFDYTLSIQIVVLAIIGGQSRLLGAVLGSAFVIGLPERFRGVQKYEGILYGIVLLAIIVFAPGGIAQLVDRVRSAVSNLLSRKPTARPTVVAASRVEELPVSAQGRPLRLDDVHVEFGGVAAVRGVSLDIPAGQVLGIIGPNGAGKTTLFNAVCGVVRSRGRVHFGDEELTGLPTRRRAIAGVGRTFQNLSLHAGLTPLDHAMIGRHRFVKYGLLREVLRLPSVIRHERAGVDESMALLDVVGLGEDAVLRADDLPYGKQKRVDVARALAARPRLLLLDEPAAGLPPDEADALLDHVLEITRPHGTTVVIIEHNVELVRRVCDRLVAMAAGAVIADGAPDEVLSSPAVVEAYLGG